MQKSLSEKKKLPHGWRWTMLGDVCDVQKGTTPHVAEYADSGIRIIKFRDIGGGKINWTPGFRSFVKPEFGRRLRRLKVGMTLIGADAHNPEFIGKKVSFVEDIPEYLACYSGEIIAVTPKAGCPVINEWPFLWLSSHDGYKAIQEKVVGVHLNKTPAASIGIPLLPLPEQKRIVAVLNKQMAVVEKARGAALERIEAVRALPSAWLREVFAFGGGGLPRGWRWQKLGSISEVISGQSPPSYTYRKSPEGLPFFQGKADFGPKNPVARVYCVAPKKVALPGDILISVRAPVGPTNVADIECSIGRGLAIIRCGKQTDKEFVLSFLKFHEKEISQMGSGSTFQSINREHLLNLEVPLPPLTEQKRLVSALNAKMAVTEQIRAAAEAELEAITALPAALLREAFSGAL